MTTLRDKFKPQEPPLPAIPESEEEPWPWPIPEAELPPRKFVCGTPALSESFGRPDPEPPDLNRFERRPATDRLAVLGVGSAVVAFLL